jgi:hypothetical protein
MADKGQSVTSHSHKVKQAVVPVDHGSVTNLECTCVVIETASEARLRCD